MKRQCFDDFVAFANSIGGVDSMMLLRDPERRSWTIDRLKLPGIELQFGLLGSATLLAVRRIGHVVFSTSH